MKNFNLTYNNVIWSSVLLFVFVIVSSCGDKKGDEQKPELVLSDSVAVKTKAESLLGKNLKFTLAGNFDEDSLKEVAAGLEVSETPNWGIRFVLLKKDGAQLVKRFETDILNGSFKESLVKKIMLPNHKHEMIYYNSQDYYWGSAGGEVFAYLIDFREGKTFYAHLFSETRRPVELFLSKNMSDTQIQKFFISEFKKDYPELRLASEDVSLEF